MHRMYPKFCCLLFFCIFIVFSLFSPAVRGEAMIVSLNGREAVFDDTISNMTTIYCELMISKYGFYDALSDVYPYDYDNDGIKNVLDEDADGNGMPDVEQQMPDNMTLTIKINDYTLNNISITWGFSTIRLDNSGEVDLADFIKISFSINFKEYQYTNWHINITVYEDVNDKKVKLNGTLLFFYKKDTDGDGYTDDADYFPLDPFKHEPLLGSENRNFSYFKISIGINILLTSLLFLYLLKNLKKRNKISFRGENEGV